jgi:hypothetical protein
MRLYEIKLLIEGYKEATAEFNAEAEPSLVSNIIQQYRQLVDKNQVQGNERNIDWWRKQGWDSFNKFVSQKATQPTKTQITRNKLPGKSINLVDNEDWLIVIPLDKDASCFHGKNTDWCTTKTNQSYFEEYFYNKEVVLIYCLNKKNSSMWAIAAHGDTDQIEMFDQKDTSIDVNSFTRQTGLNPIKLRSLAFTATHHEPVQKSRMDYKSAMEKIKSYIESGNETPNAEIEKLILFTKNGDMASDYMSKVPTQSQHIQLLAVNHNGHVIMNIKEPTEQVQLLAVKRDGSSIAYIKEPSEPVQIAAVKENGYAIRYIRNPSEKVKLTSVKQSASAIEYIKNPSEEVQLAAVHQSGYAIRYIDNPSEEVQLAAVKNKHDAIRFIQNPTERVKSIAAKAKGI